MVSTHYVTGRDGVKRGPYYVRRWREGTRQRKAYVRPRELDAVRQACARWRQLRNSERAQMRLASYFGRMSAQQLIEALRKTERWIHEQT